MNQSHTAMREWILADCGLRSAQIKMQRHKPLHSVFGSGSRDRFWCGVSGRLIGSGAYSADALVEATLGAGRLVLVNEAFVDQGVDLRHGGLV